MSRNSTFQNHSSLRSNSEKNTGVRPRKEKVNSGYNKSVDEIEYLRAGGKTIPDRSDLESMNTPGTYRTYSHNDEQDADNDFDSNYGDDVEMYNDRGAEERFLRGKDEDAEYNSVPRQNLDDSAKKEKG